MKRSKKAAGRTGRAALPSMTELLSAAATDERMGRVPRVVLTEILRRAVDESRRDQARNGHAAAILDRAAALLAERAQRSLRRVINATGIVLHTGLGRAPLAAPAIAAIVETAAGYCNLEFDLATGERGRREEHAERLLRELTGCEAALVVNNNAAATMLALAALAAGRDVIVSRGQLVEIGGSYRLPDVMAASGAVLREVGTTNKTRIGDYAAAIGPNTALLARIHTSNYRIVGFSESASLQELVDLGRRSDVPVYDDLGSGALSDDPLFRAADEPTVAESVAAGADVVSFSGDKLLGGPQAGIIVGRAGIIARLRAHPLTRALRVDKLTLAALSATLELHLAGEGGRQRIPVAAMLRAPEPDLKARAERFAALLAAAAPGESFRPDRTESFAGGGSLPATPLPSWVVRWKPHAESAVAASARLRTGAPPVVARIESDAVVFDVRTLTDDDFVAVTAAVSAAPAGRR